MSDSWRFYGLRPLHLLRSCTASLEFVLLWLVLFCSIFCSLPIPIPVSLLSFSSYFIPFPSLIKIFVWPPILKQPWAPHINSKTTKTIRPKPKSPAAQSSSQGAPITTQRPPPRPPCAWINSRVLKAFGQAKKKTGGGLSVSGKGGGVVPPYPIERDGRCQTNPKGSWQIQFDAWSSLY